MIKSSSLFLDVLDVQRRAKDGRRLAQLLIVARFIYIIIAVAITSRLDRIGSDRIGEGFLLLVDFSKLRAVMVVHSSPRAFNGSKFIT